MPPHRSAEKGKGKKSPTPHDQDWMLPSQSCRKPQLMVVARLLTGSQIMSSERAQGQIVKSYNSAHEICRREQAKVEHKGSVYQDWCLVVDCYSYPNWLRHCSPLSSIIILPLLGLKPLNVHLRFFPSKRFLVQSHTLVTPPFLGSTCDPCKMCLYL